MLPLGRVFGSKARSVFDDDAVPDIIQKFPDKVLKQLLDLPATEIFDDEIDKLETFMNIVLSQTISNEDLGDIIEGRDQSGFFEAKILSILFGKNVRKEDSIKAAKQIRENPKEMKEFIKFLRSKAVK